MAITVTKIELAHWKFRDGPLNIYYVYFVDDSRTDEYPNARLALAVDELEAYNNFTQSIGAK